MIGDVHVRFCEHLRGAVPLGDSTQYIRKVAKSSGTGDGEDQPIHRNETEVISESG